MTGTSEKPDQSGGKIEPTIKDAKEEAVTDALNKILREEEIKKFFRRWHERNPDIASNLVDALRQSAILYNAGENPAKVIHFPARFYNVVAAQLRQIGDNTNVLVIYTGMPNVPVMKISPLTDPEAQLQKEYLSARELQTIREELQRAGVSTAYETLQIRGLETSPSMRFMLSKAELECEPTHVFADKNRKMYNLQESNANTKHMRVSASYRFERRRLFYQHAEAVGQLAADMLAAITKNCELRVLYEMNSPKRDEKRFSSHFLDRLWGDPYTPDKPRSGLASDVNIEGFAEDVLKEGGEPTYTEFLEGMRQTSQKYSTFLQHEYLEARAQFKMSPYTDRSSPNNLIKLGHSKSNVDPRVVIIDQAPVPEVAIAEVCAAYERCWGTLAPYLPTELTLEDVLHERKAKKQDKEGREIHKLFKKMIKHGPSIALDPFQVYSAIFSYSLFKRQYDLKRIGVHIEHPLAKFPPQDIWAGSNIFRVDFAVCEAALLRRYGVYTDLISPYLKEAVNAAHNLEIKHRSSEDSSLRNGSKNLYTLLSTINEEYKKIARNKHTTS